MSALDQSLQRSCTSPAASRSRRLVNRIRLLTGAFLTLTVGICSAEPMTIRQQPTVNLINAYANTSLMMSTLQQLTAYNNRYYKSATGDQSAEWFFGQVKRVAESQNVTHNVVTVKQVTHQWGMKSVIARIEGSSGNQETVILGAQLDSINQISPMNGRAPGANDGGSGTVALLEAFRLLVTFKGRRPIEFHWYAGEEGGLLASRQIANEYRVQKRVVAGMLAFLRTGYPTKARPDIGVLMDYVDPLLTDFLKKVAYAYVPLKAGDVRCGYGCASHASWWQAGYASSMAFESKNIVENPMIHTAKDSIDTIDFDHALQFAKIAVAFAVEMSIGP